MSRPPGRCVFCGNVGVSDEHIWSDWLRNIIPRGWNRYERFVGPTPSEDSPRRKKQGAVHGKVARKVCEPCNRGWMSAIVQAAKPHATKLILGEPVTLGETEQLELASWLALSALMADQIVRTKRKFPPTDLAQMFINRYAPPHWHIAVGRYVGPEIVAFDHSPLVVGMVDTRTNQEHLNFTAHSVSTILGQLYVLVQSISPSNLPLAYIPPWSLYAPYVWPIWPRVAPMPWPPPPAVTITGTFNPDGGLARDLTQRRRVALHASIANSFREQ